MAKQEIKEKCPILRAMGVSYCNGEIAQDICLDCLLAHTVIVWAIGHGVSIDKLLKPRAVRDAIEQEKCVYETQRRGRSARK